MAAGKTTHGHRPALHDQPPVAAGRAGQKRRADATRNITAILDAALACLRRDPDCSVGDIAKQAGVGRVTLYGHFASREALLDATFAHAVGHANEALDAIDIDDLPADEALVELLRSSWQALEAHRSLLAAVHRHLPAERIRGHHGRALRRLERLVARGQRDGAFRTDLSKPWLVACIYSVLHTAADEVEAGRLKRGGAADVLTATLTSLLRPDAAGLRGSAPRDQRTARRADPA